jgi:CDP-6-deoxy-D-xylo-4-hexulose-3-dehydrase
MNEDEIRKSIRELIIKFYELKSKEIFIKGKSKVQYSGAVFDDKEVNAMIAAILDGWFGLGKNARIFEENFSKFLNVGETVLTNSGSSANLISVSCLMSNQFKERIKPGDEIITPACTFPTTFNPLIQSNLKPVLLDIELGTYNMNLNLLKQALSDKTRAIMLPHTLGNPNDMNIVMEFAEENNLFIIEDSCDALGSKYNGKYTGTFGTLGTFSFYPAHQMTMGEGGAIVTSRPELVPIIRSIRDWGRACVCPVCKISLDHDYNCQARFKKRTGDYLPEDYDQRYIYSNIGYNLKPLEFQAAMGIEQLKKLPEFIKIRKKNFKTLFETFSNYEDFFILPQTISNADPCRFAFPLTIKDNAPFKRKDIVSWFEKNNIECRLIFTGNMIKHPAYENVKFSIIGDLKNSNKVMFDSFFIGVYPGITEIKMNYIIEKIEEFMKKFK